MRVDPLARPAQAAVEIVLPQRLVPFGIAVAPEHVIDKDVQTAALLFDPVHQVRDLVGIVVVDSQRLTVARRQPRNTSPVCSIVSGRPISDGP